MNEKEGPQSGWVGSQNLMPLRDGDTPKFRSVPLSFELSGSATLEYTLEEQWEVVLKCLFLP